MASLSASDISHYLRDLTASLRLGIRLMTIVFSLYLILELILMYSPTGEGSTR